MKFICKEDLIIYPGLLGSINGETPKIIAKLGEEVEIMASGRKRFAGKTKFPVKDIWLTQEELDIYFDLV